MAAPSLTPSEIDTILSTPILTLSNNITIRPYRATDAPSIAHHANDRTLWLNMADTFPHPYTLESAHHWISMQLDPSQMWHPTSLPSTSPPNTTTPTKLPCNYVIALTSSDTAIGAIGLKFGKDVESRTLELGYWVSAEYSGKGIATLASQAFVQWAFDTFPYIVRISAKIFSWNKASMRVVEKSGLERECVLRATVWKNGRLGDMVMYTRFREGLEE